MTRTLLIQFAKWPQLGKVKTRLAKKMGDQAAYSAHIELTQTVLKNLTSSNVGSVALWFDQLLTENPEAKLLTENCQKLSVPIACQKGDDLGARMFHALSSGLKTYQKVIIVGSDCPTVDKAYLEQAVKVLDDSDLVLGPAEDGGYVLLGARKVAPMLLDNIAWGQGAVLRSTVERADGCRLTYQLLDTTWDVDEYEDYLRWKR
ncbi:TIGR04282 family arsenosugar biosynthesis glycosyltransferase [Alkalimarinus alittae]|uniref:TIGR04282 family arsenosugar biosynthesis glycosyltransferase n=1 Tax=Alkalimarinus alittae TaxID=2961619 RepID=A0ABY6N629_9ALTE|nr:TIGR04282 family arsenosugar biosynthesis glycosyltransferase [Alkalimarinus alittae]UZE97546.1 TIGR04282 family arsenosugar biosynthesis glycosyltransferase [Alkalimarinus alittae]